MHVNIMNLKDPVLKSNITWSEMGQQIHERLILKHE